MVRLISPSDKLIRPYTVQLIFSVIGFEALCVHIQILWYHKPYNPPIGGAE